MADPSFVSIEYDATAVTGALDELAKKVANLYEPMVAIGEYLLLATDQRFDQEIDPAGVPWKPDSPYTTEFKRKSGRILKVLQSTGRLRNSIVYVADASSVTLGTIVPYAPDHQLGINGQDKREFLGVSEADEMVILETIQDYLLKP